MRLRLLSLFAFTFAAVGVSAFAQNTYGSTTIDIDPSSNMVTVTCSTTLDDESGASYSGTVRCSAVDGAGNFMASGSNQDDDGLGDAQVVLTFQGQAGTNYTATGVYQVEATYGDYAEPHPGQPAGFFYDLLRLLYNKLRGHLIYFISMPLE